MMYKVVVIRHLFASHAQALNYTRVYEHAHLIDDDVHYAHTHIYIADMRTKEVSKCTVTSERSIFS